MDQGQQFGKYSVGRRLGGGGLGEVFLAVSRGVLGVEKTVVIKCLRPEHREDEELVQMFLDEARIAARLSHSNVCQALDLGHYDGEYFMVVEYIDGPTVSQVARAASSSELPIPITVAAFIAREIAAGLHHIHNKEDTAGRPLRIIHRDISPQNVLISHEGDVKIIDLGVAKSELAEHRSRHGVVKGKFRYMSPEQARGEPIDQRVDIYACGVMLHELLAGQRRGDHLDVDRLRALAQAGEMASLVGLRDDVSEELAALVARATARVPDQRHATAEELGMALAAWVPAGFTKRDLVSFIHSVGLVSDEETRTEELVNARDRAPGAPGEAGGEPLFAAPTAPTTPAMPATTRDDDSAAVPGAPGGAVDEPLSSALTVPAMPATTRDDDAAAAPAGSAPAATPGSSSEGPASSSEDARANSPAAALASVMTEQLPGRTDDFISGIIEVADAPAYPSEPAALGPAAEPAAAPPLLSARIKLYIAIGSGLLFVAVLALLFVGPLGRPTAMRTPRLTLAPGAASTVHQGFRRAVRAGDHEATVVLFQRLTDLDHPATTRHGARLAYRRALQQMLSRRRASIEALARAGACDKARQQAALLRALAGGHATTDAGSDGLGALLAGCRQGEQRETPSSGAEPPGEGAIAAAAEPDPQTTQPGPSNLRRGRSRNATKGGPATAAETVREVQRLLSLGRKAYGGGQHQLAAKFARRVLSLRPENQRARQLLGIASCFMGRRGEAARVLRALAPQHRQSMRQVCERVGVRLAPE